MQRVDGGRRRRRSWLLLWRRRRGADGLDPRCYFRVPHAERGIQTHLYLASTPRRPRDGRTPHRSRLVSPRQSIMAKPAAKPAIKKPSAKPAKKPAAKKPAAKKPAAKKLAKKQ